jgi:hypothetical protein
MTETRGAQRAETARQNDDSDIIEAAQAESLTGQVHQGQGGGNLQRDLGTQAEQARTRDPAAHEGVKKGDHMAHGQHTDEPHPATSIVTESEGDEG